MAGILPFKSVGGKDDTAAEVLSLVSETKDILQQFLWEWWEGIAFYRGDQWTVWDHGAGKLRQRPVLPWRIRLTDNQILPLVMRQQAMLTERRPMYSAMPRTEDDDDVLAAEAFEAMLTYHWDRLDCTDKLGEALLWSLTTGNAFWRIDWDSSAGKGVLVPLPLGSDAAGAKDAPKAEDAHTPGEERAEAEVDDFFLPGMTDEPDPQMQVVNVGDVQIRVVSPFQMMVDPSASRLEDARWVCQETYVHVDVLKEKFGAKVSNVAPDVSAEEFYNYEQSLRFGSGTSTSASEDAKSQVRLYEWWERPTKKHPEGRVVTVANGRTLDERANPYGGRFPYVHFPAVKIPGRFWADGYIKHLRPLQTMHNRALSRYHEIMNLMGNPKWIADKHAGIKETSINDRPGEVIIKTPGSEVKPISPPPAPTIHPQVMALALNAMQTITGVNDPLVGQNPPNVRSASALFGLQEAAMRSFVPLAMQTESALRNTGRLVLNLVQRFYTEDRTFRVIGNTGRPRVHHMMASDVGRIEDVTIVHGSMQPRSKAAQQDRALQMLQVAPFLFMNEDGEIDKDRLMRVLDMPSMSSRVTLDDVDRSQAYQEHIDAEQGVELAVLPWENDKLHMRIHAKKLQDRGWTEKFPEGAAALAQNYAQHEAQIQQKMMGQMVGLQGGGPGGPAGPEQAPPGPMGPAGPSGGGPPGSGPPPPNGGPSPFGAPQNTPSPGGEGF